MTAVTWIVLVITERQFAFHIPPTINIALLALGLLTLPGGLVELKRHGDGRAWLAWQLLLAAVLVFAALKFAFND